MKEYVFHSALPPERVYWRLSRYHKGKVDPLRDGVSKVEMLSSTEFCVVCTGRSAVTGNNSIRSSGAGWAPAHTAFYGTIEPEGEGSCITGHFAAPKSDRRNFFISAVVIYGIGIVATHGMLLDPRIIAAFGVLFLLFYATDNLILNRDQKRIAIRFIEKHLLHS